MAAGRMLMVSALTTFFAHTLGRASLRAPHAAVFKSDALLDQTHKDLFKSFVSSYGRPYQVGSREYEERFAVFIRRLAKIDKFNARPSRTWTAAVNHLTDRTEAELAQLRGWKGVATKGSGAQVGFEAKITHHNHLPRSHSYQNLFNGWVRDQSMCGSCWAVTASTVLSYHSEIHATNRTFSTQELVSCVPNPKNCGGAGGCEGATVELALQYTMLRGLGTPEDHPYLAMTGTCDSPVAETDLEQFVAFSMSPQIHSASQSAVSRSFGMVGWEKLPSNAYTPLITALYQLGPVAVSVAASDLSYYASGIFDCDDWVVNHAVTLVGYGVDKGEGGKYYLVQNSWGEFWGENGYFRLTRRDDEQAHCGSDDQPQDGVACEGETEPVTVCGTCGILFDSVVPHFSS